MRPFFSNLLILVQGHEFPELIPAALGTRRAPALDRTLPSQGHSHPHSLRLGQLRHTSTPPVFGMWADQSPRENPRAELTPHTQRPLLGIDFFFSHQCYNEMMLNEIIIQGPAVQGNCPSPFVFRQGLCI